jgi:hypothetical protein
MAREDTRIISVTGWSQNTLLQPQIMPSGTGSMQTIRESGDPGHQLDNQHRLQKVGSGGMLSTFHSAINHPLNAHKKKLEIEKYTSALGGAQSGPLDPVDMNLTFPVKLHMMLSDPSYCTYLQWSPHGRAWRILKPKEFESDIIPKFFRSAKYASFMRQVWKLK